MPNSDSTDDAVVISAASRTLRRRLRPLAWVALEEVALEAVAEGGRLVARTSARQVAERLGVDPGTAAGALRVLRREGLVALEREHGPAGRFGLAIYVLGSIPGLTVLSPRGAEPHLAGPSLEKPGTADSDPGAPDVDGPGLGRPGAAEPWMIEPHMENPRATMDAVAMSPSLTVTQCPGQTALDLGSVSA